MLKKHGLCRLHELFLITSETCREDQHKANPANEALDPKLDAALTEAFALKKGDQEDIQDQVKKNFFSDVLEFAQSISLTPRKTSVIMGIMQHIFASMHLRSTTSSFIGEPRSMSECFTEFKRLLMAHAVAPKPGAPPTLAIFTVPEARQLTDFVTGAFFQHFLLYQSVLVSPQESLLKRVEVVLERPRPPLDLRTAKLVHAPAAAEMSLAKDRTSIKEGDPTSHDDQPLKEAMAPGGGTQLPKRLDTPGRDAQSSAGNAEQVSSVGAVVNRVHAAAEAKLFKAIQQNADP